MKLFAAVAALSISLFAAAAAQAQYARQPVEGEPIYDAESGMPLGMITAEKIALVIDLGDVDSPKPGDGGVGFYDLAVARAEALRANGFAVTHKSQAYDTGKGLPFDPDQDDFRTVDDLLNYVAMFTHLATGAVRGGDWYEMELQRTLHVEVYGRTPADRPNDRFLCVDGRQERARLVSKAMVQRVIDDYLQANGISGVTVVVTVY